MRILFIYIGVEQGFSGQAIASQLAMKILACKAVTIECCELPHLDRSCSGNAFSRYIGLAVKLVRAYWGMMTGPGGWDAVHVAVGQTPFAMVRDGLALKIATWRSRRDARTFAALNGGVFTRWYKSDLPARMLRWVARQAHQLCCVGPRQEASLEKLGIAADSIAVVPNTCEYEALTSDEVTAKHRNATPLRVLFLSTLYDTKGYPEFLEALAELSQEDGPLIEARLCGPVVVSEFDQRFKSIPEAAAWIREQVDAINASSRIKVEWTPGVQGEAKKEALETAHIFVLPTTYPVEAQPLALLEAMAHGCAIVTSDIAEIPTTVTPDCGAMLSVVDARSVRDAMDSLVRDPERRLKCGEAARERFVERFSRERHRDVWRDLLGLNNGSA
ncbi:glycosyltransferase family 4 protein [Cerasicoccus maritimus]|uniref:glycosyltransferase family 4 protein n=1 Tax=Cerasicoccus maritimus TaxID=490089 RepID=UPI0028527755|nr:glycosyltransferase family 4 protein [Cerasicoccus maritimus]